MNQLIPALPLLLLVASCVGTTGVSVVPPDRTVSFASDVAPLIERSCAACHSAGSPSEGVTLCDSSGKAVYADLRAQASRVAASVSSGQMPRGGSLTGVERGLIQGWVDQGAKDN